MVESPRWSNPSLPYLLPRSGGRPDAWAEELATAGLVGSQRLAEVAEIEAPTDVAAALDLDPGGRVVVRRRVMYVGERPVELTDSYYPAGLARGTRLAEARKIPGGAVTLLGELGYRPVEAREDITARMPTADERTMLSLDADEPVLVLCRRVLTGGGVPVELSVMVMPAHGRHLSYETTIGP
ncbi:UTRA domain-containing protein [Longispora sp. K20-0274]|uniref:UTRA domain-containing protein n=1 Tax=Longispora sp. K20-0274 TaxID=3088255 RepID=UPI00399B2691